MARPTRQRRSERREQQRADGAAAERGRGRAQVRQAAEAEAEAGPAAPAGRRRTAGFIAECWAELKKVEWPGQKQVVTGTVVVIVACGIVGAYLWGVDLALEPFVERVLLGQ